MEAQHLRLGLLGAEALLHDLRPHPTGGAELRHLLDDGGAGHEEERQARGEVVDLQAGLGRRLDVRDAVGQGERDLLRRRGARLGHVVARDGDGVPLRDVVVAVREDVGDQPQRRGRREDVRAAGDVLLQHVVLDGAGELVGSGALLLGHQLVEQQQDGGRGVDGHRGRDLAQVDAVEQDAHVVDGIDGHTDLADLALGDRRVGVVAHLRRQVEGHREAHRPVRDQFLVALVRFTRIAEARVLTHRPGAGRVHLGVHTACEGVLPGVAQLAGRIPTVQRVSRVHSREGSPGFGLTNSTHAAEPTGATSGLYGRSPLLSAPSRVTGTRL
ncbi:hypothetical protein SDC9_128074 [bioreactor metagenome]|uniref:Uncharacterized protein n=1 Tax=bioreactor metagenome TaxID=1076179 RepID=A0A645CVW4_9ZZZZ